MNNRSVLLSGAPKKLEGSIRLPGSKSESNRALILKAQSKGRLKITNLSEAEDTACLEKLLGIIESYTPGSEPLVLDVGPAGTVMRFLTAYLTTREGDYILTGSPRMLERPIQVLVEALQNLGADIRYLGKEGFPPIQIKGGKWKENHIQIPANISSQYISALLLIAPSNPEGLEVEMVGELTSAPYVYMTLSMMEQVGITIETRKNGWFIPGQPIKESVLDIEPDWSGASYWYSLACLVGEAYLELPGLKEKSLQADRQIVEIMENFGIRTQFQDGGILLRTGYQTHIPKTLDFKTCPDIAQTLIAMAAGMKLHMEFTGLETLKIKETDRVEALKTELAKIGANILSTGSTAILDAHMIHFPEKIEFNTYHDHRMAMALAPLVSRISIVEIENKNVTQKSYPGFWSDLEITGIKINS